jgi:hypothetical protein
MGVSLPPQDFPETLEFDRVRLHEEGLYLFWSPLGILLKESHWDLP